MRSILTLCWTFYKREGGGIGLFDEHPIAIINTILGES